MKTLNYAVDILIPVFNELENIDRLVCLMDEFLHQAPKACRVTFIDDGSTDGSRDKIQAITQSRPHYFRIFLDKNYGLSTALKAGIDACEAEIVGYMDADNQTTPMDFLKFFDHFPEYDLVCGVRRSRNDNYVKKLTSRFANHVRRAIINDHIEDTGCPLKLLKTSYARKLPYFNGMHRFLPALVMLAGGKVLQQPIQHFERYAGVSKFSTRNRLIGPLCDALVVRWMQARFIRYNVLDLR